MKPDLKIVFLMREPVARAWFQIKHSIMAYEACFEERTAEFHETPLRYLLASCLHDYPLVSGKYEDILERWLKYFPAQQFYVALTEDVVREPAPHLHRLFAFLGVEDPQSLDRFPLMDKINAASDPVAPPPAVRQLLGQVYQPQLPSLRAFVHENFGLKVTWPAAYDAPAQNPVWVSEDSNRTRIFLYRGAFFAIPAARDPGQDRVLAHSIDSMLERGAIEPAGSLGELVEASAEKDPKARQLCRILAELWHTDDVPLQAAEGRYNVFRRKRDFVAVPRALGKPGALRTHDAGKGLLTSA